MGKYDILENSNRVLATYSTIIKPPEVVPLPRNVKVKPIPIVDNSTSYTLEITWDRPLRFDNSIETFVTSYLVEFSRDGDIYGSQQEIIENGSRLCRYENVGSGSFLARVASVVAANSKISAWQKSIDYGTFYPINYNLDYTDPDNYGTDP